MKKISFFTVLISTLPASLIAVNLKSVQMSLFRITILISIAIIFLIAYRNREIIRLSGNTNSFSQRFMLIWFGYALISLFWVKDYSEWLKAVFYILEGIILMIMFSRYFGSCKEILSAFRIMFVMVIIHNILGWYEINTGNYLFLSSADRISIYLRKGMPVSMFNNTNNFAIFMLFSVMVCYVVCMDSKWKIIKLVSICVMLSSIFLIFKTQSRACMIGFGAMLFMWILFSIKNKRLRIPLVFVIGIITMCYIYFPYYLSELMNIYSNNMTFDFTNATGSDGLRASMIKNGLIFLYQTLGFGTGAGNIGYYMEHYGVYYVRDITVIHNWWMEVLTSYGVLIFLMYLVFYIRLFKTFYNKAKTSINSLDITMSVGICCFMGAFIVGSISASTLAMSEWLWAFWGIAIAYQGIDIKQEVLLNDYLDKTSVLPDSVVIEDITENRCKPNGYMHRRLLN